MAKKPTGDNPPEKKTPVPRKKPLPKPNVAEKEKLVLDSTKKVMRDKPVTLPNYPNSALQILDKATPGHAVLAWIMTGYIVSNLAQLRTMSPNGTGKENLETLQKSESIRYLNKALGSNEHSVGIQASFAIESSLTALDPRNLDQEIQEIYVDLTENLNGKALFKGVDIKSVIENPDQLRQYRRGAMLTQLGHLQSKPLSSPLVIHADPLSLTLEFIINSTPVADETPKPTVNEIKAEITKSVYKGVSMKFRDTIPFGKDSNNLTPLEMEVGGIEREYYNPSIDTSTDPSIEETTDPVLKRVLEARKGLSKSK
jgi:hypothetical protein